MDSFSPPQPDLTEELAKQGLELGDDGFVRFCKGNSAHPRNWSTRRKVYDVGLIIWLDFYTTTVSTAGTAAGNQAKGEFGIDSTLAIFIFVSIYMFGQGFGGICFPPFSESFGRRTLYIVSTFIYCVFCVIVATVPKVSAIAVGRFVTGFLSAIPTNVVAGSIEDVFDTHARIWWIFAWCIGANLGIVMGAVIGTYITLSLGWRWVFYIAAIATGITTVLLLFIRESRPSQLLTTRLRIVQKRIPHTTLRIQNPDHTPDLSSLFTLVLIRPLRLFFTEPIVFTCAVMSSVAFGLVYLFTEAIPVVTALWGWDAIYSPIALLPLAVGIVSGGLMRFYDQGLSNKRGTDITPEDKLTGFLFAAPALAIGLWIFAWTIPPMVTTVHYAIPLLALILVGFAANEFDVVLGGYLADSYTVFAASAFAAMALLRAFLCASFPLFTLQLFGGLGANKAAAVLAGLATLFCVTPWWFLRDGRKLREESRFASLCFKLQADAGGEVVEDVVVGEIVEEKGIRKAGVPGIVEVEGGA